MPNTRSLLPKGAKLASYDRTVSWESPRQRSPVRSGAPVLHKLNQKQRDGNHQNDMNHATFVEQKL
jgi:hypothetical protein